MELCSATAQSQRCSFQPSFYDYKYLCLSRFSILGSLFSASSVASIQIHDDEIKISFLQTKARRVSPPPLFPYPSLGLRPIPLCLIYGQIIQIKQRGACAVLTLESEIRLYLLLGISRAPFKRSPSLHSPPSHSGATTMARPRAKTLMDYNEGQFLEADALNTRL